jgi:hypothetical protein
MVCGRNDKAFWWLLPNESTLIFLHNLLKWSKYMDIHVPLLWGSPVYVLTDTGLRFWLFSCCCSPSLSSTLLTSCFHLNHCLVLIYSHYQHYQRPFACSLTVTSAYWPTEHTTESILRKSLDQKQKIWMAKKWLVLSLTVCVCVCVCQGQREGNFRIS